MNPRQIRYAARSRKGITSRRPIRSALIIQLFEYNVDLSLQRFESAVVVDDKIAVLDEEVIAFLRRKPLFG